MRDRAALPEPYRQVLQECVEQVVHELVDFFRREPPPPMPKVDACFLIRLLPQLWQTTSFSRPRRTRASTRQPHSSQRNS